MNLSARAFRPCSASLISDSCRVGNLHSCIDLMLPGPLGHYALTRGGFERVKLSIPGLLSRRAHDVRLNLQALCSQAFTPTFVATRGAATCALTIVGQQDPSPQSWCAGSKRSPS